MSVRAVHWHEGMALWPHHLQLFEQYNAALLQRQHKWDLHHNWGLRGLDWVPEELVNSRFVVRALSARLPDGTAVRVPEDGCLAPLDLKEGFTHADVLTIYLGVPLLQPGKANVSERVGAAAPTDGAPRPAETRFLLDTQETEDENAGGDGQALPVRNLNVKLLLSVQDLAGYEVLPIARVTRAGAPDAPARLDPAYIPPVLSCDAWPGLREGILEQVFDRFGKKLDLRARQVVSRMITFDTRNPGDNLLLAQLHALNQGFSVLNILAFAEGVHPFGAYVELCRFAGQLAIFSDTRRLPELPRYDHDDLGNRFYALVRYLESIPLPDPVYEERPFVGRNLCLQVELEPAWLEPAWDMFVGVHSSLPPEECVRLLTRGGQLNMKLGSATNVDAIYTRGLAGLQFVHNPNPPGVLPVQAGLVYLQVNRTSQREEWDAVRQCKALAIRLNPNQLAGVTGGNIDGRTELQVQAGGKQPAWMRLTLYLTRRDA